MEHNALVKEGPDHGSFQLGDWWIEPALGRISIAGESRRLEPRVMDVLVYLAAHRGEVVTREDLERAVWHGAIVGYDAVTGSIIKLRRALGDNARDPRYIETISKSGYRLIAAMPPPDAPMGEATAVDLSDGLPVEDARSTASPPFRIGIWTKSALLIAAMAAVFVFGWLASPEPETITTGGPTPLLARSGIAVVPFENLTAESSQDYFSNGITEDLITDLSKLSGLRVVARNSILVYKDSPKTDSQIGAEVGARYIVRGSVQRAGGRVRVNVRLIDAVENRIRWTERYDRKLADIFQMQDDITTRVVSALEVELSPGERQRLTRQYAASIEAYDEFLRGLDQLGRRSGSANVEAKTHFRNAIRLEPRFARAYAGLAQAYSQDAVYDRGPSVKASLDEAELLARKALEIDENIPQVRFVIGMVEMFKGNLDAATAEVTRAIDLKPSYADGYGLLARILDFSGRPEEGLEALRQAISLNPRIPAIYRLVHGSLLYQQGALQEALQQLQESVAANPNLLLSRLYLAAVYSAAGQLDEAGWEVEEILAFSPSFTLAYLDYGFPIRDQELRQRFVTDLRRAGLPDD
ncbi:MAG: winged helix-turn-helix domain-containing protein [Sedimenticolaceae bacterium]